MFASPFVQHYTRVMRNTHVVRLLYMIPATRNVSSIDSKALLHFTGLLAVMWASLLKVKA